MAKPNELPLWAKYVRHLRLQLGLTQTDFAEVSGAAQGKISRWEKGQQPPDRGADVADFCQRLNRNPLEGFVAAGFIDEDTVGRGLKKESRDLLAMLRDDHQPMPTEKRRRSA